MQIQHLIRNLVICSLKWGAQPATPQQHCATYARGPVHFKLQYVPESAVQIVFYLEDASPKPSSKNTLQTKTSEGPEGCSSGQLANPRKGGSGWKGQEDWGLEPQTWPEGTVNGNSSQGCTGHPTDARDMQGLRDTAFLSHIYVQPPHIGLTRICHVIPRAHLSPLTDGGLK